MRLAFFVVLPFFAASSVAGPVANPDEIARRLENGAGPACVAVGWVGEIAREAIVSEATFFCHPKVADEARLVKPSLFEIGSVSKGLTGLLLADMVVRGEVRLDDPAARYSRPGATLPSRAGRQITLRDVVTHTAGLPLNPPTLEIRDRRDTYADFDADALYASLAITRLATDIGTTHSYSNFGFMWLSEMLSRAGGRPFPELLKERVLGPLGMDLASVTPEGGSSRVAGHSPRYEPTPPWHFKPQLAGMGGVHASIGDMERLVEALAGRRKTSLDAAVELAIQPLFKINDTDSIGFAWLTRSVGGSKLVWHSGQTGGFSAVVVVDRARGAGAVVLADSAASFQDLAFHLVVPEWPLQPAAIRLPVDAATRKAYSGRYQVPDDVELAVFEDGETLLICCTVTQPWAVELARQDADWFAMLGFPIRVAFMRDVAGAVAGLSIDAKGTLIPAKRVP